MGLVDPVALAESRKYLKDVLRDDAGLNATMRSLLEKLEAAYKDPAKGLSDEKMNLITQQAIANRSMRNRLLGILQDGALVDAQYKAVSAAGAENMTERFAAFQQLVQLGSGDL